jgi:hypothetical protein
LWRKGSRARYFDGFTGGDLRVSEGREQKLG